MPVMHQEVATYEGNDKVAQQVFQRLISCERETCDKSDHRQCFASTRLICWAGDQLTCSRYRNLIKQRAGEFNSYDRYDNLDPISGLFHMSMTIATSLHSDLGGTGNDHGMMHNFTILERTQLHDPKVAGDWFHGMDEGAEHQCISLVRALWVEQSGKSVEELRHLSPESLMELATGIYNSFASNAAIAKHSESERALTNQALCDPIPAKMMVMTRDLLRYVLFRRAIKTGDVGIIRAFLPELLFRFVGGGNSNYAVEIAEMIQRLEVEYSSEHR